MIMHHPEQIISDISLAMKVRRRRQARCRCSCSSPMEASRPSSSLSKRCWLSEASASSVSTSRTSTKTFSRRARRALTWPTSPSTRRTSCTRRASILANFASFSRVSRACVAFLLRWIVNTTFRARTRFSTTSTLIMVNTLLMLEAEMKRKFPDIAQMASTVHSRYGAASGLPPASMRNAATFLRPSLRRGQTGPKSACWPGPIRMKAAR
mmetsp:Transcript_1229/g.2072  ORF Transcript_1229/g.2072 Transcript_1229/m.2072 type:complete len:210 (-) Transcript_1229:878-1507(-)